MLDTPPSRHAIDFLQAPDRLIEETLFFGAELERAGMRRSAVILNRVHRLDSGDSNQLTATARLTAALGTALAEKVARTHADVQRLARRDEDAVERLRAALHDEPICLLDRETDVHDIVGLIDLHRELFVSSRQTRPRSGAESAA